LKVYLAGGMHGDWRSIYIDSVRAVFYSPKEHDLTISDEYTLWDLTAIEQCDVFLGFMEADNPSGQGLTLEIGYAKALGKKIILVVEDEFVNQDRYKYFLMAEECADVVLYDHDDALKLIQSLSKII